MAKTLEEVLAELKAPPMNGVDFSTPVPKQFGLDDFFTPTTPNTNRIPGAISNTPVAPTIPAFDVNKPTIPLAGVAEGELTVFPSASTRTQSNATTGIPPLISNVPPEGGFTGLPTARSTVPGGQLTGFGSTISSAPIDSDSVFRGIPITENAGKLAGDEDSMFRAGFKAQAGQMLKETEREQFAKTHTTYRFAAQQNKKILGQMKAAGTSDSEIERIRNEISAVATNPAQAFTMLKNRMASGDNLEKAGRTFDKRTLEKLNNPSSQTITRRGKVVEGYGDIRTQAKSILDFGNSVGPDIAGGKTYFELMTPSEWKRFRRGVTDMATGGDPTQLRRVNDRLNADMKIIKDREEKKVAIAQARATKQAEAVKSKQAGEKFRVAMKEADRDVAGAVGKDQKATAELARTELGNLKTQMDAAEIALLEADDAWDADRKSRKDPELIAARDKALSSFEFLRDQIVNYGSGKQSQNKIATGYRRDDTGKIIQIAYSDGTIEDA